MAIQLLGYPTTLGLPRTAAVHAPEALRGAGLMARLTRLGQPVIDHGDMALPPGRRDIPVADLVRQVVEAARVQKEHWLQHLRPGDLPLTIGGDHSTSLGTIWALAELGHDFDVVWIDAHGDFNILETSPSGNPHGMVLSLATGLLPDLLPRLISPQQLRFFGIRDLDPGERALLERERVEVPSPDQVRQERERLLRRLKPHVFLSFDIDSVDPSEAPGTMTPVPHGFRREEALGLVAAIARQRKIIALDLVEYHPDYDRDGITAALALDVLTTALTGSARDECASASGVG